MQISVLEINRESIIMLWNELPKLFDSSHLKKYVHIAIELPKTEDRM